MRRPGRRFLFRLALALHMPVVELERRMPASEIAEWKAFYRVEPFGWEARLYGFAMVCALILSVATRKQHYADEFMPRRKRDSHENWEMLKTWARLNGLKVGKKGM